LAVVAARGRSATEVIMWKQEKEYLLAELLDHPALTLALAREGMERQSIELLLDVAGADDDRKICRVDEPVFA
jgi:hypothetical protein